MPAFVIFGSAYAFARFGAQRSLHRDAKAGKTNGKPQNVITKPINKKHNTLTKIKDIKSGSVFEVPLDNNYGFCYVKLVFSKDIDTSIYECLIIKVYDLFKKESFSGPFDKMFFETDDILFYPWLSLGFPPLRGDKKWKHLGYSDLTSEDKIFPDFLDFSAQLSNVQTLEESYSEKFGFAFRRNFKNDRLFSKNIDAIKHLGSSNLRSPSAMVELLTMHFMNKDGFDLPDIYPDVANNSWTALNWKESLNRHTDIRTLPKNVRLRALDL